MKKIFFILLTLFICLLSFGQKEKQVSFFARSYNDRIVLRLFVNSPTTFYVANNKGYIIERANAINSIDNDRLSYSAISGSPFKRLEEKKWEELIKNADPKDTANRGLVGLAFVYSDTITNPKKGDVLEKGMQSIKENRNSEEQKLMFATLAANRSKIAAKGLAQWIEDKDVQVGKVYVYRVKLNDDKSNSKDDWFYLKVICKNFNENYLRNDNKVILKEGDKKVSFTFPESDEFYAFEIEKSNDDGKSFKRITDAPRIKLTSEGFVGKTDYVFADSNLINYKKYTYRILLSTVFADNLLLSQFVAMPRDKTPPPAVAIKSAINIKPNEVEILWQINDKDIKDLKGFNVLRSKFVDSAYQIISTQILSSSTKKYIDNKFQKDGSNYYIVESVDTAGNISQSYPAYVTLIDSTPPAIPIITKATIDSLGKITIKIKPNVEKDFMGYQLLKANEAEHEFSVVQETYKDSLGATTFVLYDSTTLQSLTPNIFYKLIAFDTHYNQSEPSEIIKLKRPDTIPPVSPIIKGFKLTDSTVILSFSNSSSDDVVVNYLLRREVSKEKFDTILLNKDMKMETFVDKKIVGGNQYEYTMMAKDEANLLSKKSRSLFIKTLKGNDLPAPIIQAVFNEKQKTVTINYKFNVQPKARKVQIEIYRKNTVGADWVIFKSIDVDANKPVIDDKVPSSGSVFYIAKTVDENKNSSIFSKPTELKLK